MKRCGACHREKRNGLFAKKMDGLSSKCKSCIRRYSRDHYDKDKRAEYTTYRSLRLRAIVRIAKARPCLDCKREYPYYVMDFDHVAQDKKGTISTLVRDGVTEQVLRDEISKCEVVCSNCHRVRTHSRLLSSRSSTVEHLAYTQQGPETGA